MPRTVKAKRYLQTVEVTVKAAYHLHNMLGNVKLPEIFKICEKL